MYCGIAVPGLQGSTGKSTSRVGPRHVEVLPPTKGCLTNLAEEKHHVPHRVWLGTLAEAGHLSASAKARLELLHKLKLKWPNLEGNNGKPLVQAANCLHVPHLCLAFEDLLPQAGYAHVAHCLVNRSPLKTQPDKAQIHPR